MGRRCRVFCLNECAAPLKRLLTPAVVFSKQRGCLTHFLENFLRLADRSMVPWRFTSDFVWKSITENSGFSSHGDPRNDFFSVRRAPVRANRPITAPCSQDGATEQRSWNSAAAFCLLTQHEDSACCADGSPTCKRKGATLFGDKLRGATWHAW